MSDHPIIGNRVRSVEAFIPIPHELLQEYRGLYKRMFGPLTDEERAEYQRKSEEREAEQRRQLDQHVHLLASTTGFRRAVLELHGPVEESAYAWPVCQGCDADGYEWEPPEWPCRTYVLARDIAE